MSVAAPCPARLPSLWSSKNGDMKVSPPTIPTDSGNGAGRQHAEALIVPPVSVIADHVASGYGRPHTAGPNTSERWTLPCDNLPAVCEIAPVAPRAPDIVHKGRSQMIGNYARGLLRHTFV
jgi:hypothetical protein